MGASVTMAAPKKEVVRFVRCYRAVNKHIEKVPYTMPNQEMEMADLRGMTCFGKIDMLQVFWQIPLEAEVREIFTIATPEEGLFTPMRVPSRRFERDGHFQGVMTELLSGLKCKAWVDCIMW